MPCSCHTDGMARTRISTTVDSELLADETGAGVNDAELTPPWPHSSPATVDERYAAAYGEHPLDEPDEWGDLASFRNAAAST